MSRQDKVGSHATKVINKNGLLTVTYHETDVVKASDSQIILDNGGYKTVTTKTRMNQASNQFDLGYKVYQKDFKWFVDYQGKTYDFDGETIVLNREK